MGSYPYVIVRGRHVGLYAATAIGSYEDPDEEIADALAWKKRVAKKLEELLPTVEQIIENMGLHLIPYGDEMPECSASRRATCRYVVEMRLSGLPKFKVWISIFGSSNDVDGERIRTELTKALS